MRIAQHLISGGTQTKAPPSIAAPIASNAIDFFRVMKKSQLLPLNAADRAWSNPIGIEKGGEHQSQILSFKRRTTCPLKRGRSTKSKLPSSLPTNGKGGGSTRLKLYHLGNNPNLSLVKPFLRSVASVRSCRV